MINLDSIVAAGKRIQSEVRRTPVVEVSGLRDALPGDPNICLKLESLQVTGSFKARGATNKLRSIASADLRRGLVAFSGGSHGVAVARAACIGGTTATIFVPGTSSLSKRARIAAWGAVCYVHETTEKAKEAARRFADETGAIFVHPAADPDIIAGQGTVALELIAQVPDATTVLVAIGGGGLISGMATAIKKLAPTVRIVGVEAAGSPTLLRSLEAGRNLALDRLTTRVATLACMQADPKVYEIVRNTVDAIVLVDDEEMQRASERLWFECGIAADLSGAATFAALINHRVELRPDERICAVVCGAGEEGTARPPT